MTAVSAKNRRPLCAMGVFGDWMIVALETNL